MIRNDFRVLVVDLSAGRGAVERLEGRHVHVGGSGLAAMRVRVFSMISAS